MITVMDDTGTNEIYLCEVADQPNARAAAGALCDSLGFAAEIFGGSVHNVSPGARDDNPDAYGVFWADGPAQWAVAYAVSEGADGKTFAVSSDGNRTVFFTDLDG